MADLAGRLNIEMRRRDGRLQTTIRSSRLAAASRVFVGKTVEEATIGLPALFSVCATAQACASVSACEAAQGLEPSPASVGLRRTLVDAETVKEHLWRILLDWPRFLDEPPRAGAMQAVMAAYTRLRGALLSGGEPFRPGAKVLAPDRSAASECLVELERATVGHVLGVHPRDWLESVRDHDDLDRWADSAESPAAALVREVRDRGWSGVGRNPVTALPRLSGSSLDPFLSGSGADRYICEPAWEGGPRESSPFARMAGHPLVSALRDEAGNGLLPRLAAQLAELAALQGDLPTGLFRPGARVEPPAEPLASGVGIALVRAARGLLVHRVELDPGRIADYRILAPTEWNFHPRGVVAQGLSALPVSDNATLERLASLFVTAVDPCVEYHVAVS